MIFLGWRKESRGHVDDDDDGIRKEEGKVE